MRLVSWLTSVGLVAGLGFASACSSMGDGSGDVDGSDGSGSGAGNGSSKVDGIGGGFTAGGGNDGFGGACAGEVFDAKPSLQPADIIFAIDGSPSMADEIGFVHDELNKFSQQISQSGIDVRVIMLAGDPNDGAVYIATHFTAPLSVCVDAPLGQGQCDGSTSDHNPPHYHHPKHTRVASHNALDVIVDSYSKYGSELRKDANTYVVIITDDDAEDATASSFISDFTAKDPSKLTGFTTHAIYCFSGSTDDCQEKGRVYEDLVNRTGGIHGNLQSQNFKPVFDNVAAQIILNASQLPCEFPVPDSPQGETLDPKKVNVIFTDGSATESDILKVDGKAGCHATAGGWYYDDASNPSSIELCPASCDVVSSDPKGSMGFEFGCETKIQPPA